MEYKITLKGHLFLHAPGKERHHVISSIRSMTPADILEKLEIPLPEVYMAASKGKKIPLDEFLPEDGDVEIYPVIGGG